MSGVLSPDAVEWARGEAARIAADPSRFLSPAEQRRFEARLFTSVSGIPLTRRLK